MTRIINLKGITQGYIVRREWLPGEGPRVTWHVVWKGEETATYPRLLPCVVDLLAWHDKETNNV